MHRLTLGFLIVFFLGGGFNPIVKAANPEDQLHAVAEAHNLKIEVSVPKSVSKPTDLLIKSKITNIGSDPISFYSSSPLMGLKCVLLDGSGTPLPLSKEGTALLGPASLDNMKNSRVVLKPNQSLDLEINLADLFVIKDPGPIQINLAWLHRDQKAGFEIKLPRLDVLLK